MRFTNRLIIIKPNLGGRFVINIYKGMGVSRILGGAPGLPPKVCVYIIFYDTLSLMFSHIYQPCRACNIKVDKYDAEFQGICYIDMTATLNIDSAIVHYR